MTMPVLSISTDKSDYVPSNDVIVTATVKGWKMYPLVKMRLVIWNYGTGKVVTSQYFPKPAKSDTVKWTVTPATFSDFGDVKYDAQLEFAALPAANVLFTH